MQVAGINYNRGMVKNELCVNLILNISLLMEKLARKHIQVSAVFLNQIPGLIFKGTGVFNLWERRIERHDNASDVLMGTHAKGELISLILTRVDLGPRGKAAIYLSSENKHD